MDNPPLHRFLRSVGRVQHHVHTIVVGLSGVEMGTATKPGDLDIAWKAHDVVGSAREARSFLLRATLIFVAEEMQSYAIDVLRYQAQPIPAKRRERILAHARAIEEERSYLTVAALVVSHWRNRIVHRNAHTGLTRAEQQDFLAKSEPIRIQFKGVDAARLLEDFDADRPTLKDVTVLVAMCIRFVKEVDAKLPPPRTAMEIRRWLEAEELLGDVLKLEREAANGGHPDPRARAKQYLLTRAPGLAEAYYAHGATVRI
jgi:hypothetical protein